MIMLIRGYMLSHKYFDVRSNVARDAAVPQVHCRLSLPRGSKGAIKAAFIIV